MRIPLVLLVLAGCHPAWTPADRARDIAQEAMASKLYQHEQGDAGDPVARAESRAILCAAQATLAAHDAGRLSGPVDCQGARTP